MTRPQLPFSILSVVASAHPLAGECHESAQRNSYYHRNDSGSGQAVRSVLFAACQRAVTLPIHRDAPSNYCKELTAGRLPRPPLKRLD
jgi:hypothetical protein